MTEVYAVMEVLYDDMSNQSYYDLVGLFATRELAGEYIASRRARHELIVQKEVVHTTIEL